MRKVQHVKLTVAGSITDCELTFRPIRQPWLPRYLRSKVSHLTIVLLQQNRRRDYKSWGGGCGTCSCDNFRGQPLLLASLILNELHRQSMAMPTSLSTLRPLNNTSCWDAAVTLGYTMLNLRKDLIFSSELDTGGTSPQFWYANPPPPCPPSPLSCQGSIATIAAIHMVAPKAPEFFFSFPLPTWHPSLPMRWSVDGRHPPLPPLCMR